MVSSPRIAIAALMALVSGCPHRDKEPPIWEQVKIGEIGATGQGQAPLRLNTTNLDVHVFQIPSDRVRELHGLWDALSTRQVRYKSHQAFRSNAFRAARCSLQQWDWVLGSLKEVGANKTATLTQWLSAGDNGDVAITPVRKAQNISFTDMDGRPAQVGLAPGRLVLRLGLERMGSAGPARQLVACPVFTVPTGGALPQIAAMAKAKEVAFWGAAFSASLREGDVLVLGPEDYYGDPSTLGGLFFCDPQEALVVEGGKGQTVQRRRAVRIYVLVCTHLSEGVP